MKETMICKGCGKQIVKTNPRKEFCSDICKKVYFSKLKYPDNSEYVECKICGFRAKELLQHIRKVHKVELDDYCKQHNMTKYNLMTETEHKRKSESTRKSALEGKSGWQKGGKNPAHSEECRSGRRSPWSMNYKKYDGLTDEEKKARIAAHDKMCKDKMNVNHNNPLRLDYYTSRGYSKKEAKKLLKERQSTFSLAKCIEKYGEEEGRKIFDDRQVRWQKTLNDKPIEEIERINRAKMMDGRGYSRMSQELFKQVEDKLNGKYKQLYYATNNPNSDFNEYMVVDNATNRHYFLDFYVKDNNKVIEFDGDYWHGEKRGNQTRDKEREEKLKELGFTNILRVRERDYKANPKKTIDECVKFIES